MQTGFEKNSQGAIGNAGASSAIVQASSTWFVFLAAVFAAVGGLLFGYDTAAISGAVIFIKQQFSLSTFPEELVVGMVLVGAALAALGGGRLSDRLGRRTTLILTSIIFILGALICAFADSFQTLLVGRTIVGLGIGLASTTVPVYISEVSPPRRGAGKSRYSSLLSRSESLLHISLTTRLPGAAGGDGCLVSQPSPV